MKIAILGVSGMLGSAAFQLLSARYPGKVFGTARSSAARRFFDPALSQAVSVGIDVENVDALAAYLQQVRPDVIVNCIGIVKQLASSYDPLVAIPINSILPHRLARLADLIGARVIHISTDCVFTGRKGNYTEEDMPDAEDLYGRSKLLGEVDYPNAITLRTSIIGREIGSQNGLVEWFLSQVGSVKGFKRAIFSGFTTDALVNLIADHVLPHPELHGVYQVSVDPISKFDLLHVIKDVYGVGTTIVPDEDVMIDRSLNSARFRSAAGYAPPSWHQLISDMRAFDNAFFARTR